MNKPTFLVPFIFVYKIVRFIIKIPFIFMRYFALGLFFILYNVSYYIGTFIYKILKYAYYGFTVISYFVYNVLCYSKTGFIVVSYEVFKLIKYLIYGIIFPFVYGIRLLYYVTNYAKKARERRKILAEKEELARKRNKEILEENRKRFLDKKQKEKEEKEQLKQQELLEKQKRKEKLNEAYINENVKIEKKGFKGLLESFFLGISNIPKKIKGIFTNSSFAKNRANKRDINRQALLIDFDGEDAEKSETKIMYEYEAKDSDGKYVKGYFPAFSRVEVHSFLLGEGFEVYSIKTNKWIQALHGSAGGSEKKIKTKDLIFFTTQLSTYIKAGIPLVESLRILSRQFKNKTYQRIFKAMIYDLTMGDNFSDAMNKQGKSFPKLLINMIKASEMTGELPEALDDMADYFTQTDKTRKQMITAMMYPAIILVIAIAAIIFIMVYVVPKFVVIYASIDNAELPAITVFVMRLSEFLKSSYYWLILGIVGFIGIIVYLYKNIKMFKTFVQWCLMHLPIVGNVIIYNEVTMFTKTFASLLSHNVFITDSMEVLNKITNNEVYKMLILDTISNLAKGEKISLAFKDHWAFPIPAYEMLVTGEKTGQLPEMMDKVAKYYQEMHANAVARIKTFIEPILIIFLTVAVGGIVLSIVIPMFNVYTSVQS